MSERSKPGLYRVVYRGICAGFVVDAAGYVASCAPILRNRIHFWRSIAVWIAP